MLALMPLAALHIAAALVTCVPIIGCALYLSASLMSATAPRIEPGRRLARSAVVAGAALAVAMLVLPVAYRALTDDGADAHWWPPVLLAVSTLVAALLMRRERRRLGRAWLALLVIGAGLVYGAGPGAAFLIMTLATIGNDLAAAGVWVALACLASAAVAAGALWRTAQRASSAH
jgi:hypothetical protein